MNKISLICPHCGGPFQIDDEHALQSEWQCPYCNKRSQFKFMHGELTLQSILQEQPDQDSEEQAIVNKKDQEKTSDAAIERASNNQSTDSRESEENKEKNPLKSDEHKQVDNTSQADVQNLLVKLEDAYNHHHLPLFNSLSRKILEIEPLESSVYVWRAILVERAGGFSRFTWADPIWQQRVPSQRKQIICQHFYNLTTAASLTHDEQERQMLADTISQLIADQIIQLFTEAAQLRRRREFGGQFSKKDLAGARPLRQTIIELSSAVPDLANMHMQNLIWHHLEHQAPKLAAKIKRYFPWP